MSSVAPEFRPRLSIVECEGHGRYFEVYEQGEYAGTFEHDGIELGRRYAGRIAAVYGYTAYEHECAKRIEANPDDWDCSDVVPAPVLCIVRPPEVNP